MRFISGKIIENIKDFIAHYRIKKAVRDLIRISKKVEETETGDIQKDIESMNKKELEQLVRKIKKKMNTAAAELNFELAASLRDQMLEIRKHMNE